jgi:choline dehydrogenase-like flavoprotein
MPAQCDLVYDAVVVGAGITGAWAAKELAEAGFEVLLLDGGPELRIEDLCQPRRAAHLAASKRQPIQRQHPAYWANSPGLFIDDVDHPYSSDDFVWIRGRQVGGRSLTWGGVLLRFSDYEFRSGERDGVGPSWPITYADLAPHYDHVERFWRAQGARDGLPQLPDGVFDAPPPMTLSESRFRDVVQSAWSERHVIHCRGTPSTAPGDEGSLGAGWQPKTTLHAILPAALATGRVVLRGNTVVTGLRQAPSSPLVESVECRDCVTGASFRARGRVVVLGASTIETVRILLNSRTRRCPEGIGNSSGLLGRHLLDHAAVTYMGSVQQEEPCNPCTGGAHGFLIPRFRNLESSRRGFVRGYGMWGSMQRGSSAHADRVPWALNAMLEVLPDAANRVSLDRNATDAFGVPVPRIELTYRANELAMTIDAELAMEEMLTASECRIEVRRRTRPGAYVHELGGARMGDCPETSVLDSNNQCWDADNLFVVDGSCFVTAAWQNPTLTMAAIAVRASRYVTQRFG